MGSTRDGPAVVIANGAGLLGGSVAAWVADDPGVRAVVVVGGLRPGWDVSAGARRYEA